MCSLVQSVPVRAASYWRRRQSQPASSTACRLRGSCHAALCIQDRPHVCPRVDQFFIGLLQWMETLTLPSGQPLLQRSNCFHIAALHRVILPVLQQQLQVLLNRGTGVQSEAVLRLFALHRTTAPTLLHSRSPPLCQAQKFCGCNTMRLEEPLHCQQSSVLKKHVSLRQCARESMTQSKPCLVHHKPICVHDMFMIW